MSKMLTVKTELAGKEPVVTNWMVPETIKEAVELWGENVVLANAIKNAIVKYRQHVKEGMRRDLTGKQIEAELGQDFLPVYTGKSGKPKIEKVSEGYSELSSEEQAVLLKRMAEKHGLDLVQPKKKAA